MRALLTFTLIICLSSVQAQSKKVTELLKSIDGQWKQDKITSNVTYVRVIDVPGKNKLGIYQLCDDFILTLYDDIGKGNIDKDYEVGSISSSGWLHQVHSGFIVSDIYYADVHHVLKIETKDNKARITLDFTQVKQYSSNETYEYRLADRFPINPKSGEKNFFGKTFYKTHLMANKIMDRLEKTLVTGDNTGDW